MSFTDAIKACFQKYVVFNGRALRSEYWYWVLFNILVMVVLTVVDLILFGVSTGVFSSVASIALLLPSLAVLARRLHDVDRTGWWMLIVLVPLVGAIILIIWACMRGTPGPNRFGPEPA